MSHPDAPPVSGYDLLRRIGGGSYGEVWLARDVLLGIHRALKIVWLQNDSDSTDHDRAQRRGRAERVRRGLEEYLRHAAPNRFPAIAVLDIKQDPGGRFFHYTMPLADDARTGREIDPGNFSVEEYEPLTLAELCHRDPRRHLSAPETIAMGARLAGALAELHAAGVVHQDIKPSNIIFLRGEPIFADIDLVRSFDATRTVAGTPGYTAPEGPGTPSADIYSLGKTLFVAATGSSPHTECPTPPDDWDRRDDADALCELNLVWLRACEIAPAIRYKSAASLRDELKLLEAGQSVGRLRRTERWLRTTVRMALVAVPLALLATGLAFYYRGSERAKAFALHRSILARATYKISQGRLKDASEALDQPEAALGGPSLELDLLRQEVIGDPATVAMVPGEEIEYMAFSPDGRRLAAQSSKSNLQVFVARGLKHERVITNFNALGGWLDDHRIIGTRPTPLGKPLAIWNVDTAVRSPDLHDGTNRRAGILTKDGAFPFADNGRPGEIGFVQADARQTISWVRWGSPPSNAVPWRCYVARDGRTMVAIEAIGSGDSYSAQYYFHDLADPSPALPEFHPIEEPKADAMSPDGRQFAYAEHKTGSLTVRSGLHFKQSLARRFGTLTSLGFSPDGNTLASGGEDQVVRLHDAETLEVRLELHGHRASIKCIAWSPDGQSIATGDTSGAIRYWDLTVSPDHGRAVEGLKAGGGAFHVTVARDSGKVAVPDSRGDLALLDPRSLSRIGTVPGVRSPIHISNNHVWAISTNDGLIHVDPVHGLRTETPLPDLGGNPVGLANADGTSAVILSDDGIVITTLPPTRPFVVHPAPDRVPWNDVALSEDGALCAVVGEGTARFHDMKTGALRSEHKVDRTVFAAAFLPGNQRCLLACDRHTVLSIEIDRPGKHERLTTGLENNYDIIAIPSEDRFVTAGNDGEIAFNRLHDGIFLTTIGHPRLAARKGAHQLRKLALGPDSRTLYGITDAGILVRWDAGETRTRPTSP